MSPIPLRSHDTYELFPNLLEPSDQCNQPKSPQKENGAGRSKPGRKKGSVRSEERPRLQIVPTGVQEPGKTVPSAGIASPEQDHGDDRLMSAPQVAARLGVSERFIRDHTLRRSPRLCAVKLGKLLRYRRADVDVFVAQLATLPLSRQPRPRA